MTNLERMKEASIRTIVGPTIILGSGSYYDFVAPETSEMTVEDFAYGLAGASRFSGQCVSRRTGKRVFYTVAQHCVLMSHAVPRGFEYDALMHEAGEPACGDMTGPLKLLCPDFKTIEKRCERANFARFKVEMRDPDLINLYDLRKLATEKRDLTAAAEDDTWHCTGEAQPLTFEIEPWGQYEAAERFIRRYMELAPPDAPRPLTERKATDHASTSPGPVNCLLRMSMQSGDDPRTQPSKCARCSAVDLHGCIFFDADGSAKKIGE